MSSEKIRVAIVYVSRPLKVIIWFFFRIKSGAGIVGATLANLLLKHQDEIEVELFESAKQFTEIGAGIGLWARAMNVLREAGIYEAASKIAVKPDPNDPGKSLC